MSVRFLLGASGSGKSRQIYNEIIQASIKEPERNFYLIVPEQYTMEAQRELVTMHPAGGMMNIDAIGMNRLAYRVFDELGISTGQVLEDFGKSMLIKKILCEQQDTLQVYGSYYDKLGFVDEMKSMMSEIFQYNIKQDTIDEIMEQIPEDSVVAGKMQDIRHIYEEFEAFAGERYIVAEQLVELLTRHVGRSKLVCGSSLYFDGFTGFTPVQLELVEKLMTCADNLTFSFTLDDRDQKYEHIKDYELFYLTKTTIKKLTEAAAAAGVEIESPVVLPGTHSQPFLRSSPPNGTVQAFSFCRPAGAALRLLRSAQSTPPKISAAGRWPTAPYVLFLLWSALPRRPSAYQASAGSFTKAERPPLLVHE